MKELTKKMIKDFELDRLGYDFMGYIYYRENELSFHHLIVPKRLSKKNGLVNDGYLYWNGAILKQLTSHNYLHVIEKYDRELFLGISNEMIDENLSRKIKIENLRKIRDYLLYFEREYANKYTKKGTLIIKDNYLTSRIKL